jgi:hypothetical protein
MRLREALNLPRWRIQLIITKVCCGNLYENFYFTPRKKKRKTLQNNTKCFSEQMEEKIEM